jgi:CIC family chloride channel protein
MPVSAQRIGERWWRRPLRWWDTRPGLVSVFSQDPLDLRLVGRTLLHAALVGMVAGLVGAFFFVALEYLQVLLLERLAGYAPLRARGETFLTGQKPQEFRPWVLVFLPALGGLVCGLLTRLAPEARGGGTDQVIEAFHHRGGVVRRKVIWVKLLASLATLGSGGAGGREGPTMQIGGALGSLIGRWLHVSTRERRVLLVAGVAAGISAVFRTPLGAALLAVEVLYRDGFEADALIPAIFGSVVAYSIVISVFGESTLLGHAPSYPFVPSHLPLFALLALLLAGVAIALVKTMQGVRRLCARLPIPEWMRAAFGGLAVGAFATPLVMFLGNQTHAPGQGLGILGGGYGAVQMSITGSEWLPPGWTAVLLLLGLSLAKLVATAFTVGSGGSAGDFAPSLAIGALFGGAFGRAAQILLQDPRLDPGAFALVGMGAFYGGIAHVRLAALVLVCELAGNYDLLVPLMLALGVASVALRSRTLYPSQVATQRESPVHRDLLMRDILEASRVGELVQNNPTYLVFEPRTSTLEMLRMVGQSVRQQVFPVVDQEARLLGLVTSASLHVLAAEHDDAPWMLAADIMQPALSVRREDGLRTATELMVQNGLRELPVLDEGGHVVGYLDEAGIARVYLEAAIRADQSTHAGDEALSTPFQIDTGSHGPNPSK